MHKDCHGVLQAPGCGQGQEQLMKICLTQVFEKRKLPEARQDGIKASKSVVGDNKSAEKLECENTSLEGPARGVSVAATCNLQFPQQLTQACYDECKALSSVCINPSHQQKKAVNWQVHRVV